MTPQIIELAAKQLGASACDVQVTQVTGDASTRAYFRARAGSKSLIIALYNAPFDERISALDRLMAQESVDPTARLKFANDPCAHLETTALFLDAQLPVPRIFAACGAERALLIEDVGDVRLQDWLHDKSADEVADAYRRAVDFIVRIQGATWQAQRSNSITAHLAFDAAKLRWELSFFFVNYFGKYRKARLDAVTANAVKEDFDTLCKELAARPRVLAHRDYHARNLMMRADEMFIIDFQDARLGAASYDLASLLYDPYTTLDTGLIEDLIARFLAGKAASGESLMEADELRAELQLTTVQRMLKAIGTYASQAAIDNPIYLPYIAPALDRALTAMQSLGRFDATRQLLERDAK